MQRLESKLLDNGYLDGIRYKLYVEKGEISPVVPGSWRKRVLTWPCWVPTAEVVSANCCWDQVTERILRQALCPVLTVGPNFQPHSSFTPRPKSILLPTNFRLNQSMLFLYAVFLARGEPSTVDYPERNERIVTKPTTTDDRARGYAMAPA